MTKPKIVWVSKLIDIKLIDNTDKIVKNFKIATALGQERLKKSLGTFGLAGNMVVNPYKGRYILVDGNSRLKQELANGTKKVWVSMPSKPLSVQQFKEMAAMFDVARAGDVDMDRINSELGTTKKFMDDWSLIAPKSVLDRAGKKAVVLLEKQKEEKRNTAAAKKAEDKDFGSFEIVQLMFAPEEFQQYTKLMEGNRSPSVTVLKALQSYFKKNK